MNTKKNLFLKFELPLFLLLTYLLGWTLALLERCDEARDAFEQALDIDPETLSCDLAEVFQMLEGSITDALAWIQGRPVEPCDRTLTLPVSLKGSSP